VPTGYGLVRHLTAKGYRWVVAAPSLTPRRVGDKVKTERPNACEPARLLGTGDLTSIWVPAVEDEAVRDVSRARDATRSGLKRAMEEAACRMQPGLDESPVRPGGIASHTRLRSTTCAAARALATWLTHS
jgi:hypothetical protein